MEREYFGATVLHRRILFKEAALDGRTVRVRLHADHTRRYREFRAEDTWNVEGRHLVNGLEFEPIEVDQPEGVAGRVFSTYKPLLSAARPCADQDFVEQLRSKLLAGGGRTPAPSYKRTTLCRRLDQHWTADSALAIARFFTKRTPCVIEPDRVIRTRSTNRELIFIRPDGRIAPHTRTGE